MTTIFCSLKLQKLFGLSGKAIPSEFSPAPLGDWNGHLFSIERKKCLVFVNNRSYYSLFITNIVKKDLANFKQLFLSRLIQQMSYDLQLNAADLGFLEDHYQPLLLSKTNNDKKTIGIINDLIDTFKVHCEVKYDSIANLPLLYENGLLNITLRGGAKGPTKYIDSIKVMKVVLAEYKNNLHFAEL